MTKIYTFPDEEKIIRQIQEEYKEGLDHVRQKRAIKQEGIKDYVESSKDKVRKHIIYTFMQAYMSVLYTGTHTARWSGEGGRIQEKVENLNQIAEFEGKKYFIVLANNLNTILHNPEVGGSSRPIDTILVFSKC